MTKRFENFVFHALVFFTKTCNHLLNQNDICRHVAESVNEMKVIIRLFSSKVDSVVRDNSSWLAGNSCFHLDFRSRM